VHTQDTASADTGGDVLSTTYTIEAGKSLLHTGGREQFDVRGDAVLAGQARLGAERPATLAG
jgi:large exoprotein involved in heme utilization and adhesion